MEYNKNKNIMCMSPEQQCDFILNEIVSNKNSNKTLKAIFKDQFENEIIEIIEDSIQSTASQVLLFCNHKKINNSMYSCGWNDKPDKITKKTHRAMIQKCIRKTEFLDIVWDGISTYYDKKYTSTEEEEVEGEEINYNYFQVCV